MHEEGYSMEYRELYKTFKKNIPECIDFCATKEQENMLDENDGIHIFFGMVIVPYFIYLIDTKQEILIKKVSSFFESMAESEDVKVQEVLDFTVLEQLADEGHDKLEQCKRYMENKTLEHCIAVEKYFY